MATLILMYCQIFALNMEDLLEMVAIVKKTKFKTLGLRNLIIEPNSQLALLYEGIAAGRIKADEDIPQYFKEAGVEAEWFVQLKSNLKNRLLDMLLLLDLRKGGAEDRSTAYAVCMRKWACVTILLNRKARASALSLLHDLLRSTERFEFTEITVEILRMLCLHEGLVEGEPDRFGELETRLAQAERVRMAEYNIQRVYLNLVNKFVRKKAAKGGLMEQTAAALEEVQGLMREFLSYEVHLYGRLVEMVYWDARNDQAMVARLAQSALDFFKAKPYNSQLAMQAFYYYLMTVQFSQRNYGSLPQLLETAERFFDEGTHNWFKIKELEFLCHIQTGIYDLAQSVYDKTVAHAAYAKQPAPVWEMWKIFEAWLAFLALAGLLQKNTSQKFKIHKFMNEIEVYNQDKSGMNIAILIVQFLHHLIAQNYGVCIDRVEALAKYRQRYLRDPSTMRSQLFVRMLELIPRCCFSHPQVEQSVAFLYDQMVAVPFLATNQNHEVEILPYETVWQIVMANLPAQLGGDTEVKVA